MAREIRDMLPRLAEMETNARRLRSATRHRESLTRLDPQE